MEISFTVTGTEEIWQDLHAWEQDFYRALDDTLSSPELAGKLRDKLREFVEKNVYDAYTPTMYPRRSENPGFGVALNETDKNAMVAGFADALAGGGVLQMTYNPSGSHSGKFGDFFSDADLRGWGISHLTPIKPNPVHGDDLIRRIETGKGYDWENDAGPRPFWTAFVEWALDDDGILLEIAIGLSRRGYVLLGGGVETTFADGAI